jgi:hypothetical protein
VSSRSPTSTSLRVVAATFGSLLRGTAPPREESTSSQRKLKDGVWELRVDAGNDPITGKPKSDVRHLPRSSPAADLALRDLADEQAPSRSDDVGATFGQPLDQWLEECERMDLSPTTIRTYRAHGGTDHLAEPGKGEPQPPDREESR